MIKKFFEFYTDKIQRCADSILDFLQSIDCHSWDELIELDKDSREIVNDIINNYCETMTDVNEVKFLIKLKLSSKRELQSLLKDYESTEDYEKCQLILQQINSL